MEHIWLPTIPFPQAGWLGSKLKRWLANLERPRGAPAVQSKRKATPQELDALKQRFKVKEEAKS